MTHDPGSKATPAERAERIQKRRTRIMLIEAVLFFGWQISFLAQGQSDSAPGLFLRKFGGILSIVWVAVLLLLVGAGGAWFVRPEVRALLEDETTLAHRRAALAAGFWAAMAAAMAVDIVAQFETVSSLVVLHVILSVGVAVPLGHFAVLERRAARAHD
jgi:hypothetical protein